MNVAETLRQIRMWGLRGAWRALRRRPAEWRLARRLAANVARHADTAPKHGVTVVAPLSGTHSLSKTMRDFVTRLRRAGIPYQAFDTFADGARAAREDWADLVTPPHEFNLLRYTHTVEMLKSPLPPGLPLKRCRIAFWESARGILRVFPYLADSDAVIAMSDFNEACFRRELPPHVRVVKIPYPLLPPPNVLPDATATRARFGIAAEAFVVFYNFDIRSVYRKNPHGAVEAFAAAFDGDAGCRLVLKVNGTRDAPEATESLRAQIAARGLAERTVFITEYLPQTDLYALTAACDVYLSLHRAEGFGLGVAEAMLLGKAVVATDWSATTEFCTADTAIRIPYRMTPVTGDGFWRHMGEWAEPDVSTAADALRRLRADTALRLRLGESARALMSNYLSDDRFRAAVGSLTEDC